METNPDDILPPDDVEEEEPAVEEQAPMRLPDQLVRDGRIPVDPATGEEFQSGEVPLGWSEPLP